MCHDDERGPRKVGPISVIHNGIIGNLQLRAELARSGSKLSSETEAGASAPTTSLGLAMASS